MNKQLENMKKKELSTAKTISDLKEELENAKKMESIVTASTNTIHKLRRELEKEKPRFEKGIGEREERGVYSKSP